MTNVYLIRHCEAEGNIYRRAQGQYDGRISPKGARQIAALAERFQGEAIDALWSSDLYRARRTAEAILKYHESLTLRTDPRLREINIGVWEDVPFGNLGYDNPEMMAAFNNDPAAWRAEGAETFPELTARFRAAVEEIAGACDGQTVAIVSHGMAIRSLLADYLGYASPEINRLPHGDNTAVSLLKYRDGVPEIVYMNDAGHLTGGLSTLARQSWWKSGAGIDLNNVRFRRLDPAADPEAYVAFYEKSWRAVHNSLKGFQPEPYLAAAKQHALACPDALVTIVRPDGAVAGITELDTERYRSSGIGWICLCYVEEPVRRNLLGAQLIGHAVSLFRHMGYHAIRLNVFEGNAAAIRFYEAYEFHTVGRTDGALGKLLIMEKEL